ncbi:MAG: Crp/Fnr family transcriptional regulator [Flavobacteriales bacterium]|nr:Crp/Fnr family transcriptional regulator [Flavobacteriales bacterium]
MSVRASSLQQAFVDLFTRELGLSESAFDLLLSKFHVEFVPKRFFYLKAGDVSTHKAYVNRGCSRSYVIDAKGKEHVLFFGFEDWWLGDFESYETRRPGKQFVQAVEDLELLCIRRDDLESLHASIPVLLEWEHQKRRRMAFGMIERLIEVKTLSPEERLNMLVKKRPDIFQRVAMHDIASYLDIEPQSLSRLRKRMLEHSRSS